METEQNKTSNASSKHVRLKRLLAPREIKFRAKLFKTDEWVYGGGVQKIGENYAMISLDDKGQLIIYQVQPETVGQFTGLKDENDKEIYEGDIISEGIMKDLFTVIFTDYANFGLKPLTEEVIEFSKKHNRNFEHETIDPAYAETTLEVMGNIFENPELLP